MCEDYKLIFNNLYNNNFEQVSIHLLIMIHTRCVVYFSQLSTSILNTALYKIHNTFL